MVNDGPHQGLSALLVPPPELPVLSLGGSPVTVRVLAAWSFLAFASPVLRSPPCTLASFAEQLASPELTTDVGGALVALVGALWEDSPDALRLLDERTWPTFLLAHFEKDMAVLDKEREYFDDCCRRRQLDEPEPSPAGSSQGRPDPDFVRKALLRGWRHLDVSTRMEVLELAVSLVSGEEGTLSHILRQPPPRSCVHSLNVR